MLAGRSCLAPPWPSRIDVELNVGAPRDATRFIDCGERREELIERADVVEFGGVSLGVDSRQASLEFE